MTMLATAAVERLSHPPGCHMTSPRIGYRNRYRYRYIYLGYWKPNNFLIKREKVVKQVKNAHNKPTTQREGLSLLVVTRWYLVTIFNV